MGRPATTEMTVKEKEDYHKSLTRVLELTPRKDGKENDGYFQFQDLLDRQILSAWRLESGSEDSEQHRNDDGEVLYSPGAAARN